MLLLDKLQAAAWLLTKRGTPWKRFQQHRAWKRGLRHWIATEDWGSRIRDAVASPDNAFIPRHEAAGKIVEGQMIMHNGLRVGELSYSGPGNRKLMMENRGVHEPQEERVFQEVLKWMPEGAVMLELGSYWAFYSMWFYQVVQGAHCYGIEPAAENLEMGIHNFALNFGSSPARVSIERAYVGSAPGQSANGVPIISVDSFMAAHNIAHLNILHADTQGWEVDVLVGARQALAARKIDYIFISTHGNQLHFKCLRELRRQKYTVLADIDYLETYSFDGLIVARRSELPGQEPVPLSLRP
ncbi:methyltransferase FkbM family [Chthoniobacter flavus Ellin428]|uniref:Methyltransferase FkbM family n=1 Tax=Chthoniobacter flavus Ellin428 TaxID=497964 RepID=B4D8N2_9BACT|nr:FkbM family methyltransferase [Chthoniobacter flavus]EDY17254.1 methyltransferase FkbM family [Chthoniobacter flavus Ellin428]TCO86923.1 FkbM family methyltransferase [Chthoniobacter flavus]